MGIRAKPHLKEGGNELLKIMIALALGFIIGYRKLLSDKGIQINGRLQTVWLLLLIFSMGMSIGMDKELFSKLPSLGWKGILFAVVCSAGSVIAVYIFSKLFFKQEEKEK